jgi:hypothetical protein
VRANWSSIAPNFASSFRTSTRADTFVARPSTNDTSMRFPSSGPHDCTSAPDDDAGGATAASFP